MARTPCAASSTAEATSPVWSWTARDRRVYAFSVRSETQTTGTVEASTTRPSGQ